MDSKEIPQGYQFSTTELTKVSPEVIDATKNAISQVWTKHVSEPTTFNIRFATYLTDENGQPINRACEYDPDSDTFTFAMEVIKNKWNLGLPVPTALIILAAHETMHKVQIHRGEQTRPSPTDYDADQEYFNDPYEEEAWVEALNLFKKLYPNASGGFTTGGKRYEIPTESNF